MVAAPHFEMILTQQDVDRLLEDPSPASRIAVLERVSQHYNDHKFNKKEHDIAEQIFRLLMKDAILTVREILADRMQHNGAVPRDIILHLAEDVESVALPVITNSEVFSDSDLVEIVQSSGNLAKLLAVTRRNYVSTDVSDALVETRFEQVVSSLLQNEGAHISHHAFDKILTDYKETPSVLQHLAEREVLPIIVVERLMTVASDTVAAQLKAKYQLSESQVVKEATSVREDVLLYLLTHEVKEEQLHALVAQMHVENRLTPSIVMTALCRGQLQFFTVAMAHLAGISLFAAKQLLADKGPLGFQRFYEKARLPEAMMPATQLVLRAVQELQHGEALPGSLLYANQLAEMILNESGDENIPYLPHFMALIRQTIQPH
jgi:uncharacterized protein (DUF2336 family)